MAEFSNPFVRGMLGAQAAANQNTAQNIGTLGGLLSIQNNMEMKPLQTALLRAQVDKATRQAAMLQNAYGALGMPNGVPQSGGASVPMAFGEGGVSLPGGAQGNTQTGQVIPAQQAQPQQGGGAYGIPLPVMSMLMSGDAGLMATGKAILDQQKPIVGREGGQVLGRNPDGSLKIEFSSPKTEAGTQLQFGPNGQVVGVRALPGQTEATEAIRGAQERAKARYDLVTAPPTAPNQPPRFVSRLDALGGGQPIPQTQPQPQPGMMTPAQINSIPNTNAPPLPPQQRAQQQIAFDQIAQGPGAIPSANILPPNAAGMSPAAAAAQKASEQGAIEAAKGRAEGGVKFENGILDAGQSARRNLTQLQIIAPNLAKLPTGPMFPALVNMGSYLNQFGINPSKLGQQLGTAQATDAILKQFALKLRDPAGGGGMPGSLSNSDRDFLVNMLPSLSKVPDGNRVLVDILSRLEQRKMDEAAIVSNMQRANKTSADIREALNQFSAQRPITEDLQQRFK